MTCWGRGGVTFDKIKKQQAAEAAAQTQPKGKKKTTKGK
jgi:hypothetical protein